MVIFREYTELIFVRFSAEDLGVETRKQVGFVPSLFRRLVTSFTMAPCFTRSVVISSLLRSTGRCFRTYLVGLEALVVYV